VRARRATTRIPVEVLLVLPVLWTTNAQIPAQPRRRAQRVFSALVHRRHVLLVHQVISVVTVDRPSALWVNTLITGSVQIAQAATPARAH